VSKEESKAGSDSRPPSEHRQIAQSALLVAAFVMLAKLIAAGKEVAVAWQYGVGDIVDAYQIASSIMLWAPITLGGVLSTVLIPIFVSKQTKKCSQQLFGAELHGWMLAAGFILAICAYLLVPVLVDNFWNDQQSGNLLHFIRIFSGSFFIPAAVTPVIFLYSAILMANKNQWNTLLEAAPSLSILLFIGAFHTITTGTGPMYWGTLAGYVGQAVCLYWLLLRNKLSPPLARLSSTAPQWLEMRSLIGPLLLSQFFLSWTTPIDLTCAIKLGPGAVAQISYAERLLSLVISIGTIAISRAVLPVFSELAAREEWQKLYKAAIKWGAIMFAIGVLVCCVAWPLSSWGVATLFQRGAFTAADTAAVAEVFRFGLTRVPFLFAGVVFFQLLASQKHFFWVAAITLICVAIKYPANMLLSTHFGPGGINIATGLMYFLTATLQLVAGAVLIRKRIP
jgi:peptidoglycan biosynthesis protein MviN/MurJ (putative lipid II flippase)